jgi:hypothetical protein
MKKLLLSLFFISLFLTGCSTLKVEISKNAPLPQTKNKIIFIQGDYSERVLPIFPLIDAGIYNKRVKGSLKEFEQLQNDSANVINKICIETIRKKTGCQIIPVTAFTDSKAYDKYEKLSSEQKEEIKSLCKMNKADYAVGMTLQVQNYDVSAFGLSGDNTLNSSFYVFDKDGSIIGKGFYRSNKINSKPTNTTSYKTLLSSGEKLSEQLIALLFK